MRVCSCTVTCTVLAQLGKLERPRLGDELPFSERTGEPRSLSYRQCLFASASSFALGAAKFWYVYSDCPGEAAAIVHELIGIDSP